jgi:hypothetical protein
MGATVADDDAAVKRSVEAPWWSTCAGTSRSNIVRAATPVAREEPP